MSPELIAPQRFGFKNSHPTKFSDCYALGMVVYETISGKLPFHEHTDLTVITKVLEGEHPPRGAGFTKTLWEMLELCWVPQPNNRPSIESVLRCLEAVSTLSEPPYLGVEGETREDGNDWDSAINPGVPNWASGTIMTKRTTTYSGLDDPRLKTWSPGLSFKPDVDSLGREVTGLDFSTTQTDSDGVSASQVSTIYHAGPGLHIKRNA